MVLELPDQQLRNMNNLGHSTVLETRSSMISLCTSGLLLDLALTSSNPARPVAPKHGTSETREMECSAPAWQGLAFSWDAHSSGVGCPQRHTARTKDFFPPQDTTQAQSQLQQCSTSGDAVARLCPHIPAAGHAPALPQAPGGVWARRSQGGGS